MAAKATFDIVTRTITLTEPPVADPDTGDPVVQIDVQADLYSAGKKDWLENPSFRALIFPIRVVGGDRIPTGFLDGSFFLRSDWKIQPFDANHRLQIEGNFYSEDGSTPFLFASGRTVIVEQNLSAIVGSTFADEEAIILAANFSADPYVYFDSISGTTDITTTAGTRSNPVRNVSDAFTLASQRNKHGINIVDGVFTLDRVINRFDFVGSGDPESSSFDFNGFSAQRCSFSHLRLTGNANNSRVHADDDAIVADITAVEGIFTGCFLGDIVLSNSPNKTTFKDCRSYVAGGGTPIVDCVGREGAVETRGYAGGVHFENITNPLMNLSVDFSSGHCRLAASCTDANGVVLRGVGKFTNNSSIDPVKIDTLGFQNPSAGATAVWEADLTSFVVTGTAGRVLQRINSIVKALLGLA